MTYIRPQTRVFQDFQLDPVLEEFQQNAHISGGNAQLIRYSEASEKADGLLGYYDPLTDTDYLWPNRPAGGLVDQSYSKIWIEDALLEYFSDAVSAGSDITKVSGVANQVASDTISFKSNGASYPRSASLYDRDVQVGDIVRVDATVDSEPYTLWTYVRGFVGEDVAAVTGTAVADDANAATDMADATTTKVGGVDNCVTVTAESASGYNGLSTGDVTETYTVRVIQSSVDSDFTTARLSVTSASGNDDVASVTPSAAGVATAIGARGATMTFDLLSSSECSEAAEDDEVSPDDLIVGQEWELDVIQTYSAPTAASGGTFTGTKDTTYIVEITRGGLMNNSPLPQITVTNDLGTDISGPTDVTGASGADAIPVGTKGVTITLTSSATTLAAGDRFTIPCTAATKGAMRTLVLGHNLPEDLAGGSEVGITLYIKKSFEVDKNRTGFAPLTNWDQSATQVTMNSGLIAYDSTWTDNGTELPLDVKSASSKGYGKVYAEARYWLPTLATTVGTVSSSSDLADIPGPTHPDNPLKYGVFKALENSNGVDVKYTAVADPDDDDSWAEVLSILDGREDVYGLAPMTYDETVLGLYQSHVNLQSTEDIQRYRVLWTAAEGTVKNGGTTMQNYFLAASLAGLSSGIVPQQGMTRMELAGYDDVSTFPNPSEVAVVNATTSSDGEEVLATLSDDPDTSGTQYTLLQVPGQNGLFVENGVRAGDTVRFLYTGDGFGNFTYSEFVVDAVNSEDEIRLASAHSVPVSTPVKVEIWRTLNENERAAEVATGPASFSDRRVRYVVPGAFNGTNLDAIAEAGGMVVTQDPKTGTVYVRHAVTTGDTDIEQYREESITRNTDNISKQLGSKFEPYIGRANAVESMLNRIEAETLSFIQFLRTNHQTELLGGQIVDGEITELRISPVFKDRILLSLTLQLPLALNNIDVYLLVSTTD